MNSENQNASSSTANPGVTRAADYAGTQTGTMGGSSPNAGIGHSVSDIGSVQFTNLSEQLPSLSFPATSQQIQQAIGGLPPEQQTQYEPIISQLPADATFNSWEELQSSYAPTLERQLA